MLVIVFTRLQGKKKKKYGKWFELIRAKQRLKQELKHKTNHKTFFFTDILTVLWDL